MPKIVDPQLRRNQVIDASFRVIARKGLHATTLQKVADEAGLNIGSVRHYVANHEELLTFAMRSMMDRVSDRLVAHVDRLPGTAPHDGTRPAVRMLSELLPLDAERRLEVTVWMEFSMAARVNPTFAEYAAESARGTRQLIKLVITAIQHGRPATKTQVERIASLVDGLAFGCVLYPDLVTPRLAQATLTAELDGLAG